MASKKVKTVKELNVEVDKILDKIKGIEKNLEDMKDLLNCKIKELENKLENRSIECMSCSNAFKTETEFKNHIKQIHPKK